VDIIEKFEKLEELQRDILSEYSTLLNRTFQIIYELKTDVDWGRVYRLSPISNFIMISGRVVLPKGTVVGESTVLPEDSDLDVTFTVPLIGFTDNITPYQLAEMAKAINSVRQIVGADKFTEMLWNKDTTMDTLYAILPSVDEEETKSVPDQPAAEGGGVDEYPYFLNFQMSSLTKEQIQSYELGKGTGRKWQK
jgi:hypothetical protein